MTTGPSIDSLADESGQPAQVPAQQFAALYGQIRRIAQRHMLGEAAGHTLSATGLANEVWLRMRAQSSPKDPEATDEVADWASDGVRAVSGDGASEAQSDAQSDAFVDAWAEESASRTPALLFKLPGTADMRQDQLLALCSTFMRRILVDHARSKLADKRGAKLAQNLTQSVLEAIAAPTDRDTVAVHDTLLAFEAIDPGAAKVVEMRFFGGLSLDEIAIATGRSASSVKRDWTFARAWLHKQLGAQGS